MSTKITKAELETENVDLLSRNTELERQIAEATRQSVQIPLTVQPAEDDGGSFRIDHGTILDNHVTPDTNKEAIEDILERDNADLSFWNNSWAWNKSKNSYGNKPEDSWFVNPTPKLIGEVMNWAPMVHTNCRLALEVGEHTEQLAKEKKRHVEFLRSAEQGDIVSESLDLLTAYQNRFFESVQRYIGLCASYDNQVNSAKPDQDRIGNAAMKKGEAASVCRGWVARLLGLIEGYHSVVTDERAYKLSYNFSPAPPDENRAPTKEYGLFKWAVTQSLNKVGRRLARSVKEGKMDAEKYRIPRPWLTEAQLGKQINADALIGDFN